MCGRFTLRAPASKIAEHFALLGGTPPLAPRYNIAPTQPVVVVRVAESSPAPHRETTLLRWGLVPHWAKDPGIGARMINARAETVAAKPAFRAAFRRRRCLVPTDGFYEWRTEGARKQPYFIRLADDGLFAFAGLWEAWEGPDHSGLESCTLLTTEANALMRPIHDRMPVILRPSEYGTWLDPTIQDAARLAPLLKSRDVEPMQASPVDLLVNNPRNDSPQCLAGLDSR